VLWRTSGKFPNGFFMLNDSTARGAPLSSSSKYFPYYPFYSGIQIGSVHHKDGIPPSHFTGVFPYPSAFMCHLQPVPVLKFNTPKGNRLLQRILQNNVLKGVSLADLNTTVLPQTKVGVSLQD
jgi:hypothetical protein